MVEMPKTDGIPTLEQAVRAMELTSSYLVPLVAPDAPLLGGFVSRIALQDALTPMPWEDKDQSLARFARHALENWPKAKRKWTPSQLDGADRLASTLKRYVARHSADISAAQRKRWENA